MEVNAVIWVKIVFSPEIAKHKSLVRLFGNDKEMDLKFLPNGYLCSLLSHTLE